jgi:hypothetical protein
MQRCLTHSLPWWAESNVPDCKNKQAGAKHALSNKQMGRDPINSITTQLLFILYGYLYLHMTHYNTVTC